MKVAVFVFLWLPMTLSLPRKFSQDILKNSVNTTANIYSHHSDFPNDSKHHKTVVSHGGISDPVKRLVLNGQPVYVRLQHGQSAHEGRAELFALGRWGTICDDDWSDNDAAVICHMLGYPRTGAKARTTGNGIGSGTILLDQVHCTGTEESIEECPANNWGDNDCTHLEDAGVSCSNTTRPDNFLVFTDSTSHVIFRMDLTTHNFVLVPLHRSGNPVAIDYDPVDGRIYWTDVVMREIHSVTADAQNQLVVKYLGGNSHADGIAVDPITRLIFYTDTGKDIIALMTLDGSTEKVLVNSSLDEPRDIEVDPFSGIMYWTDWGSSPKIEKANYDGTNRQTIISTGLGFPNAIALDISGNKIYWADAKTDKIEVANLDGSSRRVIYDQPLSHEFGLTLYGNFLYFTDWTKTAVMRVSITGGSAQPVGPPGFGQLNDIHVHKTGYGLSGTNGCSSNNGGCSGICIPTSNRGSKCI